MANIKSKKKNIRKIAKQTERNRRVKSALKTLAKKVSAFAASGNTEEVRKLAREYVSALDKAAKRQVIHPSKASRHKSAVAKYIFGAAAA